MANVRKLSVFSHAHTVHVIKTHWELAAAAVSLALPPVLSTAPGDWLTKHVQGDMALIVHRVCAFIEEIA